MAARGDHDDAPITSSKTIHPDRTLFAEMVTIDRPARELYAYWREPANIAAVAGGGVAIAGLGPDHSRWMVKGPVGTEIAWEAVITEDRPGSTLFWQTAPGADVEHSGRIDFMDAGPRGAIVRVTVAYLAPARALGRLVAVVSHRDAPSYVRHTLRRFKQLMESREIATSLRHRRQFQEGLPAGGQ